MTAVMESTEIFSIGMQRVNSVSAGANDVTSQQGQESSNAGNNDAPEDVCPNGSKQNETEHHDGESDGACQSHEEVQV